MISPQPHSPTATTADFDSADEGSTPSVAAILRYYIADEDWELHNLIRTEYGWQVNLCNGEFVVVGTDQTIELAIINASIKTQDPDAYVGRLAHLPKRLIDEPTDEGRFLLSRLGLSRPKPTFIRRI